MLNIIDVLDSLREEKYVIFLSPFAYKFNYLADFDEILWMCFMQIMNNYNKDSEEWKNDVFFFTFLPVWNEICRLTNLVTYFGGSNWSSK